MGGVFLCSSSSFMLWAFSGCHRRDCTRLKRVLDMGRALPTCSGLGLPTHRHPTLVMRVRHVGQLSPSVINLLAKRKACMNLGEYA